MEIICIIGPTASGKKEIVSYLLEKFGDKIQLISCDSRKVYKYTDIGTAKPPKPLREKIRLIDIKYPDETYSAGDFSRDAELLIDESIKSGKVPIIFGGTPLYYVALFSEFFEEPVKNLEVRKKLLEKLRNSGVYDLYEELKGVDPETAKKLHPNDWIRITRALEIYYTLGIPASEARKKLKKERKHTPLYIGLLPSIAKLYEKIERRTVEMFKQGLVEEVQMLLQMGYSPDLPALNTIGYKEALMYLKGQISEEEAISKTVKNTKTYARRQLRFFRKFPNVRWFNVDEGYEPLLNLLQKEIDKKLLIAN